MLPAVVLAAFGGARLPVDLLPVVLADVGDEQVTRLLSKWNMYGLRNPYAQISGREPILIVEKPCSVMPNRLIICG